MSDIRCYDIPTGHVVIVVTVPDDKLAETLERLLAGDHNASHVYYTTENTR